MRPLFIHISRRTGTGAHNKAHPCSTARTLHLCHTCSRRRTALPCLEPLTHCTQSLLESLWVMALEVAGLAAGAVVASALLVGLVPSDAAEAAGLRAWVRVVWVVVLEAAAVAEETGEG